MTPPLIYLTLCSVRNRIRVRFRRLRQPRYFLGSIAGLAYFALILRPDRAGRNGARLSILDRLTRVRGGLEVCGGTVMLVIVALSWVFGSSRPAMAFSPAEAQFLFPAPISRRSLIRYKVIRTQLAGMLGSVFMTLVLRPPSAASGLIFFLGMLGLSSTLSLHLTGVTLRRQSLRQHGQVGFSRQALPIGIVWAGVAIVFGTLAMHWTSLQSIDGAEATFAELQRLGSTGAAGAVLWPFRMLVRLPLAGSWPEFFRTLPFVGAFLAANYFWVIRSDAAFEEASAERAEEQARIAAIGPAGLPKPPRTIRTPFVLGLEGPTETALLWKNLILLGRFASLTFALRLLPTVVILGLLLSKAASSGGLSEALAIGCLVGAGFAVAVGPYMARNDLRADLTKLTILKSWPVPGGQLVRGEILAPAALLTAIAWIFIAGSLALSSPTTFGEAGADLLVRLTWAAAAALAAPGLIVAQLIVHNGMALMFPAWVRLGPRQSRGIDTMGQMMLMALGMSVVVIVAVIPALLAGAAVGGSMFVMTGTVPVLIPVGVASFALLGECAMATELLGGRFDRMDISDVEAQEA